VRYEKLTNNSPSLAHITVNNKKAVLSQTNGAMSRVYEILSYFLRVTD